MTDKQYKIRILKKALKILEQAHADGIYAFGICSTIKCAANSPSTDVAFFGIKLPKRRYVGRSYCWPRDKRGAAIRRRVLKNAIKRLEKS